MAKVKTESEDQTTATLESTTREMTSDPARQLYAEQIKLLYTHTPVALLASTINSTLITLIQWKVISHLTLILWLTFMMLITGVRYALVSRYEATSVTPEDANRWGAWHLIGTACSGIGWGASGIFLFPKVSIMHQTFLAFVLGGMTSGAVVAYSPWPKSLLAFIIPSLVPIIVRFLFLKDTIHLTMGGMIGFFMVLMLITAYRLHTMTVTSLKFQFRNSDLITNLTTAKEQTEILNEKLGHEIIENKNAEETLRQYRNHLEELVEERTLELATTIKQLRHEITERKQAEEVIKHLALHDTLTRLPNRRLFTERLTDALAYAQRNKQILAIMFLDLDGFKRINDTLGHHIGDLLLESVAQRLKNSVRESDTVARTGGDEFTLLIKEIAHAQDATRVAKKTLLCLANPFVLKGRELFVTSSIGISLYPSDGTDLDTLMRNADAAMYHAKAQGKNTYQLYNRSMASNHWEQMAMETHLRQALGKGELVVYYQPQVSLDTGEIIGMEALVRWNHAEFGLISPAKFIPLAEETGLIIPIGEWVLRTVCATNKRWQQAGFPPVCVAVNISARQFWDKRLKETIVQVLEETGMSPNQLQLEITESNAMQEVTHTISTLQGLKEIGVKIVLDDFGTGYSSLSYLKRFPINRLKIDRSFVCGIPSNRDDKAITTAIVAMAHSLELKVIAEGIETQEQLAFFRSLRCDEIQGFLLSLPLPLDKATELLRGWCPENATGLMAQII